MKKQILSALLLFITFTTFAQNEPEKKDSPVSFLATAKLGFAKISQSGNVDLNGNINGGDILASIRLSKTWSLDTGVSFMEFNANQTVAGNSTSLTNNYLQIPVKFNADFSIFDKSLEGEKKLFLTAGFGAYASTLLKQELQTFSGNSDARNLGWNFGISSQLGAKFIMSKNVGFRLGLESQSDISKMKKDGAEQKMKSLNAFYFGMEFKF